MVCRTSEWRLSVALLPCCTHADGFRKQLVVLTSRGKVVALHNGDGRVLWAADFGRAAGLRKLALWRLPHDVQHDIEVRGQAGAGWGAGLCRNTCWPRPSGPPGAALA